MYSARVHSPNTPTTERSRIASHAICHSLSVRKYNPLEKLKQKLRPRLYFPLPRSQLPPRLSISYRTQECSHDGIPPRRKKVFVHISCVTLALTLPLNRTIPSRPCLFYRIEDGGSCMMGRVDRPWLRVRKREREGLESRLLYYGDYFWSACIVW